MNSFISVFNPTVRNECPFCKSPKSIVHCFLECDKLLEHLKILKECFNCFREESSFNGFILGAEYHKVNAEMWQLLNFSIGESKMAIYITRSNKLRGK